MTVEQFDPQETSKSADGIVKQTTTLETSVKVIEEQHQKIVESGATEQAAKVGFVSLGCLR